MLFKYQLIYIGDKHPLLDKIIKTFNHHIEELNIVKDSIIFINDANFNTEYKSNVPTVVLYFGSETGDFKNVDILDRVLKSVEIVLPIVNDLIEFPKKVPNQLTAINGFQLKDDTNIESLVAYILEGFGMLRLSRRLFISYKRSESSNIAIQLYEKLEQHGFDVFLDTHSVRKGEPFQDELWHRMTDTDIIVLLNTPGFLDSEWTRLEIAKANTMLIGVLQINWPSHRDVSAHISFTHQLEETDFGNKNFVDSKSYLSDEAIKIIIQNCESFRARSLASRQDSLISEFITSAHDLKRKSELQPERFITFQNNKFETLALIPTIGIPQSLVYNKSAELLERIKSNGVKGVFLLFDHRNIRENWLKHLDWLEKYLPISAVKITEAKRWIQKN